MVKRVESPSSINTFKQCKRKYYYHYIAKLPSIPNIHQIRGNIAHSTLENFFDVDLSDITDENYALKFRTIIQQLLLHYWNQKKAALNRLDINHDQEKFYFEETMLMLINWTNQFIKRIGGLMNGRNMLLQEAFQELTPIREQRYSSDNYSVRGFIDAIHHVENEVHIIDYKTNSHFGMKDSIKLQLAIYSLLYFEKHGKKPSKAGIFFLRHKLKLINVDEELLELARTEIELIHGHTSVTEDIRDYPRCVTPLCKWSTGKCDFFEMCKPHG